MTAQAKSRAETRTAMIVTGVLILIAMAIRVWINDIPENRFSNADERMYLGYTVALLDQGLWHYDRLVDHYLANQALWAYPHPLRYGYFVPAAGFLEITGGVGRAALANFSTLCSIAAVVLAAAIGHRVGGRWCAVALVATSPLLLALGRRALSGSLYALVAVAALWAFFEVSRRPRPSTRLVVLAVALLTWQVAIKEAGFYVFVVITMWLLIEQLRGNTVSLRTWVMLFAPMATYFVLFGLITRDPADFFRIVAAMTRAFPNNDYVPNYQNGPWFRYVVDWVLVAPLVTLAVPVAAYAVNRRRDVPAALRFLTWVVVGLASIMTWSGISFNLRYVLVLELPFRLLVAAFLVQVARRRAGESDRVAALRLVGVAAFVVVNAVVELALFRDIFLEGGVYDPVSVNLLEALRFLPPP